MTTLKCRLAASALAVATLLMTSGAQALSSDNPIAVGIGSYDDSCGDWLAARAALRDDARKVDQYLTVAWMQGYLTGANMTNMYADPKTTIGLPSSSTISAWLDKACQDDPLKPVFFLADTLMKELQQRAGRK